MAGFQFRYRLSGGAPTIQVLKAKNTATLSKGDIVSLSTGQAALTATADTTLLGVVVDATAARTAGVTDVVLITDADAVYGVTDANARLLGATLDIAGTTGAQTVATSSNKEFVVAAPSTATEETLVRINIGKHVASKAL